MKIERTEVVWLEARSDYTAFDLANMSGLPAELLDELMECGALPARNDRDNADQGGARFEAECIALVRTARRLRDDFDLDANGLAVAVSLLRRMRVLETELTEARARAAATSDARDIDAR